MSLLYYLVCLVVFFIPPMDTSLLDYWSFRLLIHGGRQLKSSGAPQFPDHPLRRYYHIP